MEPLTAELALERARVRMNQHVRGKRGGTLEALAARLALEWLLAGVHDHMLLQADGIVEDFVAVLTAIQLLAYCCSRFAIISCGFLFPVAATLVIELMAILFLKLVFSLSLSLIRSSSLRHQKIIESIRSWGTP